MFLALMAVCPCKHLISSDNAGICFLSLVGTTKPCRGVAISHSEASGSTVYFLPVHSTRTSRLCSFETCH